MKIGAMPGAVMGGNVAPGWVAAGGILMGHLLYSTLLGGISGSGSIAHATPHLARG